MCDTDNRVSNLPWRDEYDCWQKQWIVKLRLCLIWVWIYFIRYRWRERLVVAQADRRWVSGMRRSIRGKQLLIISHLIFYHCTEKNETLCDKNLGDQLFSLFAIKTNKRKSRLSSICEIWICASSERACMSGFIGILLIPAPFSRSQKAMFVCVWSTGWVSDGDSDQISVRDPPALPRQRQPLPPRHRNLWDAPQRGRRTSWQHD